MMPVYIASGVLKVMLALRHFRLGKGQVVNALLIAYEWSHQIAGTTRSPFDDVHTPLPHLPVGWISHVRTFLSKSKSRLQSSKFAAIQLLREHDHVIMDDVVRANWIENTVKTEINYCRLYLQASNLSELCTIDGKELNPGIFEETHGCLSTPKVLWAIQGVPGQKQWNHLKRFLRREYCQTPQTNKLRIPLGKWYKEHYKRRNWSCYYSPDPEVLTIFEDDQMFRMYEVTARNTSHMGGTIASTHFAEGPDFNEDGLPSDYSEDGRCLISEWAPTTTVEIANTETFEEYLGALPDWETDLIGNAKAVQDGTKILVELLSAVDGHRHVFGASDGGLRKIRRQYGSHGWVVATHQATVLWEGSGPANGTPNSSYRAEGYGIMGFLRFIHHFVKYWKIKIPASDNIQRIRYYTDSKSMIDKQRTLGHYTEWYASIHSWPHADALMQIKAAANDILPLVVDFMHVKAHQDDNREYDELEDDAKLNKQCNDLATEQLERMEAENRLPRFNTLPACSVYLETKNGLVNGNEQNHLRQAIGREELTSYYRERYHWTQSTYDQIN